MGLTKDHDQSYAYFMCTNPDAAAECAPYDTVIEAFGGANLQLHPDFTLVADEAALELVKNLI